MLYVMTLHFQAAAFLEMQKSSNSPDIMSNLRKYREMSHHENSSVHLNLSHVRIEHRYLTSPTADLPVNIYVPEDEGPFNGLVYFHGGGWVSYDVNRYNDQLSAISASTNSVVIAVNYQKAPEHKFPIPFDDCYAALEWAFENSAESSIDVKK